MSETFRVNGSDVTRFWAKVAKPTPEGCWEWQGALLKSGYGAFRLAGKTERAHRIAYFLSKENLNPNLEILHLCNNPQCCNPAHLRQATHAENLQQASQQNRMGNGTDGPGSKSNLSTEALHEILTSRASARALGRKYGIYHKTVINIQKAYHVQSD